MIYGILLESCRDGVCEVYGEAIWKRIVQELNFEHESFTTLGRYDETLIEKVAECKIIEINRSIQRMILGLSEILREGGPDLYMQFFGECFVKFFTNYGYDKILRVAGRHFRDFLHSIDQLHDSTRFSFPKMKSPLFHVTEEDDNGAILHYK
jgi:guanylate cyclase